MLYLKCLNEEDAAYALKEVYKGIYGNHLGTRVITHKLLRRGYCWPTTKKDVVTLDKKYGKGQKFSSAHDVQSTELSNNFSP